MQIISRHLTGFQAAIALPLNGAIDTTRSTMTRENIIKQLVESSATINTDGYLADFKDNLISTITVDDFFDDLNSGDGNELISKFKAIYSSSALGVNFFGFFKRHLDKVKFLGESNFSVAQFEKKLPTGLKGKPPNLDFYLENDNCIVGIESKFLEILSPKQPRFSASYSDSFLDTLDSGLSKIANHLRANNVATHLDTAQLIKHSIGLLNNKGDKKAKLIYVYWEPLNACKFYDYVLHKKELADFADRIKIVTGISFYHFTYLDIYNLYANDIFFKQHLTCFEKKYLMALKP